jgi:multiple sugar transport system ATP-binding protein
MNGARARPGPATLGLRPEAVQPATPSPDIPSAEVERVEHLGGETLVHLRGEWGPLVIRARHADEAPAPGARVGVHPDVTRALLFDPEGVRL